jgi:hypothetical protein
MHEVTEIFEFIKYFAPHPLLFDAAKKYEN